MKKVIFALAIAASATTQKASAEEGKNTNEQVAQSSIAAFKLKDALSTLANAGALSVDAHNNLMVNSSLIEELRANGVITEVEAKEGVVCIGAGQ